MENKKLLVITSYPPYGQTHAQQIVGVASYTKNTLLGIYNAAPKDEKPHIHVLAERFLDNKKQTYYDQNIQVTRLWNRNSLTTFFVLLKEIIFRHSNEKNILIELELTMFGGHLALLALPFFILLLRLLGKRVTIVLHQVIINIQELSGHLDTYDNPFLLRMVNFFIHLFYKLILLTATKIIVFDEILRERLNTFGSKQKITVIPHGVQHFTHIPTKDKARAILGIPKKQFVLLYFGFLAWYKGADWIVEQFINMKKNYTLIIAGGPNQNHKNNQFYNTYIEKLKQMAKTNGISITGFVPEDKIASYFAAADIVVFPYRTLMSASGPLSLALSFNTPFLLSDNIASVLHTKDVQEITKKNNFSQNDCVFSLNTPLIETVEAVQNNKIRQQKLQTFSRLLSEKRSWATIGKDYYHELFTS